MQWEHIDIFLTLISLTVAVFGRECDNKCPSHYNPICGIDGRTYYNECVLKNAQCKDPSIKEKFKGRCDKGTGLSKCQREASSKIQGVFVPKCSTDGSYKSMQCNGLTGECWCVDTTTGVVLPHTKKRGVILGNYCDLSKCQKEVLNRKRFKNAFSPNCAPDGIYEEKQCYDLIGQCWCVDQVTGAEIQRTRREKGKKLTCELPKCQRERLSSKNQVGSFIPSCDAEGLYEMKQCHASTGQCWCVHTKTGVEISNTRKIRGDAVTCELPKCQQEQLSSTNQLGSFIPSCDAEGLYELKQCHASTGQCWCVLPTTGVEITNTRTNSSKALICELSKCHKELSSSTTVGFVPSCEPDGRYSSRQCDISAEECWCVLPSTGREIPATRKHQKTYFNCALSKCQIELQTAKFSNNLSHDPFLPACNLDGSYKQLQCHAATDACWCVHKKTGVQIKGTWRKHGIPNCSCTNKCPSTYIPVCASNGKTYGNKCWFRYAQCNNPSLKLNYDGKCTKQGKPECPTKCPSTYMPVCGSNGKTYGNDCWFKHARCNIPSLKRQYDGKCRRNGGKGKPTSSQDISARSSCPTSKLTAIFYDVHISSWVVLDQTNRLFFVQKEGDKPNGPFPAATLFAGMLPMKVDAAVVIPVESIGMATVIFSGNSYYLYRSFSYKSGPHSIHGKGKNPLNLQFPTSVKSLDAAVEWQVEDSVFFISGNYYWKYKRKEKIFAQGSPMKVKDIWRGLPDKIDAAIRSRQEPKNTYFIAGNHIYLVEDGSNHVKKGYPRPIGKDFMTCRI